MNDINKYLYNLFFLIKEPIKRYSPVSLSNIEKMYQNTVKTSTSSFAQKRKKVNEQGYLLISETTGEAILSITITDEINKIRKAAGIEENVCAHMFRHRFITKLFIQLIKQYDIQNKDQFRNSLMNIENL